MTPEILFLIMIVLLFIFGVGGLFISMQFYLSYTASKKFSMFSDYLAVLEYHSGKAYDIIHKDRVLVYSLEAMRMSDEEFTAISHDFVNLVIKLIGPKLYKEFYTLYGNEETFIFNLVEYFNTRYEEDEVRKQSLDDISSEETEGITNDLSFGPNHGATS